MYLQVLKDKQFLKFMLDDGSTVVYDLDKKTTIGKRGLPVAKLQSQLSGLSIEKILQSFSDKNYANYLRFIHKDYPYNLTNFGSVLEKAKKREYSRYEQYFSSGLSKVGVGFNVPITEVPKGLLKICRAHNILLNRELFESYVKNPDYFSIAFSNDFVSLSPEDLINILTIKTGWRYNAPVVGILDCLVTDYLYDATSLFKYIDNLKSYEAIENVTGILSELFDYAKMMKELSAKFEKYPKNFLTTHKIACRNYNRLKKAFEEEKFKSIIDKSLEWVWGEYCILYPNTTQEIKDEAVQQGNCVASYIQSVIDGSCHILFLRKRLEPECSLVTLELRNNSIVQAKGRFNREVMSDEQEVITKYNEKLKRMVA